MGEFVWTPDVLMAYDRYRVRAGSALPMVVLRVDGWNVGQYWWCLTAEQACRILNEEGATPITSDRFKKLEPGDGAGGTIFWHAARALLGEDEGADEEGEVQCEHCGIYYPESHCTYDIDRWLCFRCFAEEYHS